MTNVFHLPPERPRSLKRIPQLLHFPPVIECLFAERFNGGTIAHADPTFTFEDVTKAVAETGVKLTWIRPDTFLQEIARSRNVVKILEPSLKRGYTIRKRADGARIGEFVPIGHPEGIEIRADAAAVRLPKRKKGDARGQKTLF